LPINKIYSATVPPTPSHHCKIANQGQYFTGIHYPEDSMLRFVTPFSVHTEAWAPQHVTA